MGETRIGRSISIAGEISGDDDIAVVGSVEGQLEIQGKVTIERRAIVRGGIIARAVEVMGEVEGPVRGTERIELREDSSVIGDIRAPRILMADGARFEGNVHMDRTAGDRREEDET
jgi:cytoskeletal protein CcmA (bactofilin family)